MSGAEPKIRKRQSMRRKDALDLLTESSKKLGMLSAHKIEEAETIEGVKIFLLDNIIQLFEKDDDIFPTLLCPCIEKFPAVIVDMGAIPFICKGADVMAPGIKEITKDFTEGTLVIIRDINHKKALAVGKALKSSEEINSSKKGKVIQNLHYIGDKIWVAKT
ncbi:RNA-binding protein [Candidatus Bathyarchaeota archaeon]|nr:RNA-binding protein [Candidatus Bathyarchaeota archaeon]